MKQSIHHYKYRWLGNTTTAKNFHGSADPWGLLSTQPSVRQGIKQPSSPLSPNTGLAKQCFRQQNWEDLSPGLIYLDTERSQKGFSQRDDNGKKDWRLPHDETCIKIYCSLWSPFGKVVLGYFCILRSDIQMSPGRMHICICILWKGARSGWKGII